MSGRWYRDHARHTTLADGTRAYLRRLREQDLVLGPSFFAALSPRSRYLRRLHQSPRLPPGAIADLRQQLRDPRCRVIAVFIAHSAGDELVGGGRIVPSDRRTGCEFSLTVVDAWHGRGLGRVLMHELTEAARRLGYRRMAGYVLPTNAGMLKLARVSRLSCRALPDDPQLLRVSRTLLPRVSSKR